MLTKSSTWQEHEPNDRNNYNSTVAHGSGITHIIRDRIKRLIRHQQRLLELRQEQQQLRQELAEIRQRITSPLTIN